MRVPFCLVAATLLACGSGGPDPQVLAGTSWRVEWLQGRDAAEGVESTLRFESAERVTGSGGCNAFQGPVSLEPPNLSFGALASTRMACPEPEMDQEQRFFGALAVAQRFERREGRLFLYSDGSEPVMRLAPHGP